MFRYISILIIQSFEIFTHFSLIYFPLKFITFMIICRAVTYGAVIYKIEIDGLRKTRILNMLQIQANQTHRKLRPILS